MKDALFRIYRALPMKKTVARTVYNRDRLGPMPRALTFFVTRRCNSACRHCFYLEELNRPGAELSLEEIRRIGRELQLKSLLVTGGEPTLRTDLAPVIHAFGCRAILVTNGRMGRDLAGLAENILGNGTPLSIEISLEGFRKVHDAIRGEGSHHKASEALEAVLALGDKRLDVSVLTTISRLNSDRLEEFVDHLAGSRAFHILQFVRSADDAGSHLPEGFRTREPLLPDRGEMRRLIRMIGEKSNPRGPASRKRLMMQNLGVVLETLDRGEAAVRCLAGLHDGVLYPDGAVSLCEFFAPVGNVRDHGGEFMKVWTGGAARRARQRVEGCRCTHACNIDTAIRYDSGRMAGI